MYLDFVICEESKSIFLVQGQMHACLWVVFILCTYMIFGDVSVNNGCTSLHRVWCSVTVIKWGKPIWSTNKTCFCNKLSCMPIFRIHKQVYAGCLEKCHILRHSNLRFNKIIDFPVYVNVNWRKTSFMKQNWVITLN